MTADDSSRPVGSVAQEAARLVEVFAAWAGDGGHRPAPQPGPGPEAAEPGVGADADPAAGPDGQPASDERCAECGADPSGAGVGRASTCRVCPFCQGVALLRAVRPETVDRLADLAVAVADSLRALADARRDEGGARPQSRTAPDRPRAQDIPVTDEEPEPDVTDEEPRPQATERHTDEGGPA